MENENKTIFNDPDKLKRTKENLAEHFKTGINYGDKLKSWLGMNTAEASDEMSERKKALARQMVYRNR